MGGRWKGSRGGAQKSMQYRLAAHLIRNLKGAIEKFEIAHASVARKTRTLAELFDFHAYGDHAPGRA
jgi:hypothetical protein